MAKEFAHYAFYNAPLHRIEMHLVSRQKQSVVLAAQRFELDEGESIHTENSYKFTVDSLRAVARRRASSRGRSGRTRNVCSASIGSMHLEETREMKASGPDRRTWLIGGI